jgi:hypothetical protein
MIFIKSGIEYNVKARIIGNYSSDYIFNINTEENKRDIIKKLNAITNKNYHISNLLWYRHKFITTDFHYFTSPSDNKGFSYWAKII